MRHSNAFIAVVALISTALLIFYGIAALSPIQPPVKTPASAALKPLDRPKVDFANPRRGAKKPLVTLVEYGDYLCEPCSQMDAALTTLLKEFPDQVAVVWKDLPNTQSHTGARNAAEAARCADLQGAFWPFHDLLIADAASANPNNFPIYAKQVGIDPASLAACLEAKTTGPMVTRDVEEGMRLRVTATPYLFINDRRIEGAIDYEQLKSLVQSAIPLSGAAAPNAASGATSAPATNAPAPAP